MKTLWLALGVAVGLPLVFGCVDAIGQGNIAACQSFVASAKCGTFDVSSQYDCPSFDSATCDVSEYFTCLSMHYVCVSGKYDATKVSTVSECDPYVTCK